MVNYIRSLYKTYRNLEDVAYDLRSGLEYTANGSDTKGGMNIGISISVKAEHKRLGYSMTLPVVNRSILATKRLLDELFEQYLKVILENYEVR